MKSQPDNTYGSRRNQIDIEDLPLFDITKNKHLGNARSIAANKKAAPYKQSTKQRVLEIITSSVNGITSLEIAVILGKGVNTFSGRITALKAEGLVTEVGVRNGAAILRRAA